MTELSVGLQLDLNSKILQDRQADRAELFLNVSTYKGRQVAITKYIAVRYLKAFSSPIYPAQTFLNTSQRPYLKVPKIECQLWFRLIRFSSFYFAFFKLANPGLFSVYFPSFLSNIMHLCNNLCEKCPSSIQRRI